MKLNNKTEMGGRCIMRQAVKRIIFCIISALCLVPAAMLLSGCANGPYETTQSFSFDGGLAFDLHVTVDDTGLLKKDKLNAEITFINKSNEDIYVRLANHSFYNIASYGDKEVPPECLLTASLQKKGEIYIETGVKILPERYLLLTRDATFTRKYELTAEKRGSNELYMGIDFYVDDGSGEFNERINAYVDPIEVGVI